MPTIANNEGRQGQNISPTVYAQPWWQDSGINSYSSGESMRDPVAYRVIESEGDDGHLIKETGTNATPQSGLNGGGSKQEVQHRKHVASSPAPIMGLHLGTNSQMELVGHSIMLTYPCPDAKHGGILAFGENPQFYGVHQNRMPLPLPMEEEPVYVNAKQYHGILRRRQIRAKAELENKVTKVRKPYLHESRHRHAMRRARGSGGRFLNTKKLEGSEGQTKSGAATPTQSGNSSSSEHMSTSYDGNSGHQVDKSSVHRDMHEVQTSSNGNGIGHRLPSSYYVNVSGIQQGIDHLNQENWSLLMHPAPRGLAPSK